MTSAADGSGARRARTTTDATVLAVAELPASGEARVSFWRSGGAAPSVRFDRLETMSHSAAAAAIDASNAGRVSVLLGGGQARCRVCELPDANDDQLHGALRLQAESVQLGSTPPHRTACSVLPRRAGASRSGVIVEWPTSEPIPALPTALLTSHRPSFSSDVAALTALASVPEVRGPLIVVDGARGMVAFALVTPKGMALRSAREDVHDPSGEPIVRLILETALHHGLDATSLEQLAAQVREAARAAAGTGFGCTAADRTRLAQAVDAPNDEAWWRANAIHAGTAIALTGPLMALASLQAHEPGEEPDALGRVINRIAQPQTLGWVVLAAVFAVAMGPLAIAFTDYWLMRWKVSSVGFDKFRTVVDENDRKLALYGERKTRTWPMSKLLADLACCTPEGIEIEQISIVHPESVSVRGTSRKSDQLSAPEVVLRMEKLLQDSRVFSKVSKGWEPPNQMGVLQFNLSASVTAPTATFKPAEGQDWGATSLAERRYGPIRKPGDAPASGAASSATATGAGDGHERHHDDEGRNGESKHVASADAGADHGMHDAKSGGSPSGTSKFGDSRPKGSSTPHAGKSGAAEASAAPKGDAKSDAKSEKSTEEGATAPERRTPGGDSSGAEERGLAIPGGAANERAGPTAAGGRAGPTANPDVPPEPLTEQQIASMSKEEALAAASAVAKARSNKSFDDATQSRLKDEMYKLMKQVQAKSEPEK